MRTFACRYLATYSTILSLAAGQQCLLGFRYIIVFWPRMVLLLPATYGTILGLAAGQRYALGFRCCRAPGDGGRGGKGREVGRASSSRRAPKRNRSY